MSYEELRVAGESDETKALRVQKDRDEQNEYMKQQLQQQQQNWKGVFGSCAISVPTIGTNNNNNSSINNTVAVDDNNTTVSNITDTDINDDSKHFMQNTKYNCNDDLLSPERIILPPKSIYVFITSTP